MLTMAEARKVKSERDWRLPDAAMLYRLYDSAGTLLYVGVTVRPLYHRFNAHSRTKTWWSEVAGVEVQRFAHNNEALAAERAAIAAERPRHNIRSASGADPEPIGNESGNPAGPFTTSRARADQGAGNKGAWSRGHGSFVVTNQDQVQSVRACGVWTWR